MPQRRGCYGLLGETVPSSHTADARADLVSAHIASGMGWSVVSGHGLATREKSYTITGSTVAASVTATGRVSQPRACQVSSTPGWRHRHPTFLAATTTVLISGGTPCSPRLYKSVSPFSSALPSSSISGCSDRPAAGGKNMGSCVATVHAVVIWQRRHLVDAGAGLTPVNTSDVSCPASTWVSA
jgi:hypothetical protein